MNILLHDSAQRNHLLPLVFTRPVADLRIGILTIKEKYELYFSAQCSYVTQDYLSVKHPSTYTADNYIINACVCPTEALVNEIKTLATNTALIDAIRNTWIALRANEADAKTFANTLSTASFSTQNTTQSFTIILRPNNIFTYNDVELRNDFAQITKGRISQAISPTNTCIAPHNIFIEQGATVECSILNASTGPIYIGVDAEVMEGSIVRGALALCAHSALKLGTKIYGATTIGPHSKVGGEINNSVIIGYSNKAHDGFLGNSVIGEWCNLGADTNNSNLKNNYGNVKLYNYATQEAQDTELQFCGLIMGDHSKCGINTMFNTGTVVGVCANIFGAGFPPTHISSYTWGGVTDSEIFRLDKAIELAVRVYARRSMELTTNDVAILTHVYNIK
jgi:UDP-N-acetylglucosamine diphosphorylase/glucosamine-1-phosphate N-acetyltransferase